MADIEIEGLAQPRRGSAAASLAKTSRRPSPRPLDPIETAALAIVRATKRVDSRALTHPEAADG